ncbi:MAG: hypothetical protein E6099_23950, partial [Enterobacter sp.]|nr:hypothetical protein [Enterobacter sp.]MDU5503361.1 hypothetical protein [Enterobacter sp.]
HLKIGVSVRHIFKPISYLEIQLLSGVSGGYISVIQQAYEKGMTNGKDMLMSVSGEKVCSYCLSDIKIMAERSGLKSLTLFEETTGRTLYWQSGTKGFRVKGANDE